MTEHTKLWTRRADYFLVEAFVGASWTQVRKVEASEKEARDVARAALLDRSVSKVRVTRHLIEHVCTEVWSDATEAMYPPASERRKLLDTGATGICPVCAATTKITQDGSNHWAYCPACRRAIPA